MRRAPEPMSWLPDRRFSPEMRAITAATSQPCGKRLRRLRLKLARTDVLDDRMRMPAIAALVVLAHIGDRGRGVELLDLERRDKRVLSFDRDPRRLRAGPRSNHVARHRHSTRRPVPGSHAAWIPPF